MLGAGGGDPTSVRRSSQIRRKPFLAAVDTLTQRAARTAGNGDDGTISARCGVQVKGEMLLAAVGRAELNLWRPTTGELVVRWAHNETSPDGAGLSAVTVRGQNVLADSLGDTVRLWDPTTGENNQPSTGLTGKVEAMVTVRVGGVDLLAMVEGDRTVRIRDPLTLDCLITIPNYHAVQSVTQAGDVLMLGMNAGLPGLRLSIPGRQTSGPERALGIGSRD
ncbi:hypothetical protein [Actinacidiphila sp. ITFR-21]|uniref:hypothetical protein n=1 Tax=Actinacidiphila sp. ITFR-21 TaxID=3075199 RepID=UPI00288B0805|nr:hypothetical protein [Streptomyces sp. ITFR-21]WNI16824.1 hypothetical protein RLT57_15735 [Streptomyces sp. ITFR-21]